MNSTQRRATIAAALAASCLATPAGIARPYDLSLSQTGTAFTQARVVDPSQPLTLTPADKSFTLMLPQGALSYLYSRLGPLQVTAGLVTLEALSASEQEAFRQVPGKLLSVLQVDVSPADTSSLPAAPVIRPVDFRLSFSQPELLMATTIFLIVATTTQQLMVAVKRRVDRGATTMDIEQQSRSAPGSVTVQVKIAWDDVHTLFGLYAREQASPTPSPSPSVYPLPSA